MSEKKKIGLVLYNLDSSYQATIYHGIKEYTELKGIQLFCIAGEPLNSVSVPAMQFYSASNLLPLDGLLVLSSIYIESTSHSDTSQIEKVLQSLPVMSLGSRIGSFYSLVVDIHKPYRELITHLIEDHHYKRLLYIGGSESNPDNQLREGIVRDVIQGYAPSEISLSVLNSEYFSEYEGIRLIREYQNRHNLCNIDAIIAGSDDMAIGIRRYLNGSRQISWYDCPIIGFDNIPQLQSEFPGLTTMHQPLKEMGKKGVSLLCKIIDGDIVPLQNTIPAIKKIRSSCGCNGDSYYKKMISGDFNRWEMQHIRESSYFGQTIMNISELHEIFPSLMAFLKNLGILDFIFVIYPDSCYKAPDEGELVFEKNKRINQNFSKNPREIKLSKYLSNLIVSGDLHSLTLNFFHLYSGEEQLGFIMYSTREDIHSFMSHCGVFLSQTLKRLHYLKWEKKYTEELEKEVQNRTKELKKEAARRIQVEAEVLRISELERQRFSMDLHDDVCQRLASAHMVSKHFAQSNPELKKISELIKETLRLTRQYAHDSFPMELEQIGLKEALERLCHQWNQRAEWDCNLQIDEEISLSKQKEVNIYRIVQEALFNAHKHSGAERLDVNLISNNGIMELKIQDNGTGDSSLGEARNIKVQNRRPSGLGLRSMEYRAHQLGGDFSIKSSKSQGTLILIQIPIQGQGE